MLETRVASVPRSAREITPQREIDPTTRVVVTGIGAITPLGLGAEATYQGAIAGRSGIVEHVFSEYPQINAGVAGMVSDEFDAVKMLDGIVSRKDINGKLHRSAHFSLYSAHEALQQAGLLVENEGEDAKEKRWRINEQLVDPTEIAAIIGTGVGGAETIAKVQLLLDSGKQARAYNILQMLAERVVTPVTMAFGVKGPSETIVAACATGNKTIAAGVRYIMSGDAKIAIVGGSESINVPIGSTMFDVLHALDTEKDPTKTPRPFDKSAAGFVMGEGAGVLILERLDVARQRGAKILAEVTGYGDFSDAHHDTEPSGEGGRRALIRAIERSEAKGAKGRVYNNLHGTGTPTGDPVEGRIVTEVYKERGTDVAGMSSTKSEMGHLLGAAGAVEGVICVKALEHQIMPPTLHLENPIEEVEGWNLVPNDAQPAEFDNAHSNAFGFGGLNTTVVFSRT